MIRNCAVDLVAAILAFARADKIDYMVPDCLGWFLYEFADATIISVPEWRASSANRRPRGDAPPGSAFAKAVSFYVEMFCDAGMSQEFLKAVWVRYKAASNDSENTLSLAKQRVFLQSLENDPMSDVPEKMDDEEEIWDFEGTVTAEEVARSRVRVKL